MSVELYWIAGSPFSWRALLALTIKGIPFESRLLQASEGELKSDAYLALNPRGKVPALVDGKTTVYESVAVLAYLEQAYPEPPLFGRLASRSGHVWQRIAEVENYLRDAILGIALPIYRGTAAASVSEVQRHATTTHAEQKKVDDILTVTRYLAGIELSAADVVLYPFVRTLRRATSRPDAASLGLGFDAFVVDYPAIDAWMGLIEDIPNFDSTIPPNWRD